MKKAEENKSHSYNNSCQCCSCKSHRGEYKGIKSASYIDGRTMKFHFCIECKTQISYPTWLYGSKKCNKCSKNGTHNGFYHKQHTKETKKKIRNSKYHKNLKGKNNPRYINGLGRKPYPLEFNEPLKEKIRKRDNYQCQICNKQEKYLRGYRKKLDIHHIDYDKENCKEENLITLCNPCNSKVNSNRNYWFAYFTYMREQK